MAVTSIWYVSNRVDDVVKYVVNPDKTMEKPELAPEAIAARKAVGDVKVFVRFAIAKAVINNCLKLMVNFVTIVQSVIAKVAASSKIGTALEFSIPTKVKTTMEGVGILDGAIPLWAVCFIAHIAFIVVGIILLLTVYGRFFRIYMYTAIAPIPLSTMAGQPTDAFCFFRQQA